MKKSDYIEIANKLWSIAIRTNMSADFSVREKELIKELIKKCNEVEIYEICTIDGSDGKVEPEAKGKFSFQRR